ncbi:cysteine protease [Agromyces rhizosphaerae]|uniref:Cysteine protease n=1 Tax=Agromyces rhizosphaerae TaxID=88374 RepID=A0A9W6FQJ2_9MICO|nr:transglutaminase-like domain-containing protein [Agromyces rhizosphaerae]GLI28621.1 cysteine protease [Agromyces rhizosphaerae]
MTAGRRPTAATAADVVVPLVLAALGVVGFATAFGGAGYLLAGLGGLVVGAGAGVLATRLRLSLLPAVLAGVLAYLVLGSALAMPDRALWSVLPTPETLAGLVLGAVWGWADVLTLRAPVEAPAYLTVVPYFAGWLVGLATALLATRWLPGRGTAARRAVLLVGPVLLLLAAVLLGTGESFLGPLRGVLFAALALAWLGWRRRDPAATDPAADAAGTRMLARSRMGGAAVLVAGAVTAGALAATALVPAQPDRVVVRDLVAPPFDPLDAPSPLAGFRAYTKDLAETTLFTVAGLREGERLRLAALDAYDGRLWNAAGPEDTAGAGGFALVGAELPEPALGEFAAETRALRVEVRAYDDVWLPSVAAPERLELDGAIADRGDDLRYDPASATAVLIGGVAEGDRYLLEVHEPVLPSDEELADVPVAAVPLAPVESVPDVLVARAEQYAGDEAAPIDRLRAIETGLRTDGFLSHGLASDAVASRAGHGADRMVDLFTRSQMVGDEEQYASAMALMARHLGYPARVVMGFAPEGGAEGAVVEVTGADVTAWVEVAFDGVGWVPFLPTPDDTDVPQEQAPRPAAEPQPQVRQPPRAEEREEDLLSTVEIDDTEDEEREDPLVVPAWAWIVAGVVGVPLLLLLGPLVVVALLKALRRRRRRRHPLGDRRAAGAWDEVADGYAELGYDVRRRATRRQIAHDLERQVREQAGADPRTDARGRPVASAGLSPIASDVDAAVFSGADIDDARVRALWAQADRHLDDARRASGRSRRLLSRYRIRSRRDWSRVAAGEHAPAVAPGRGASL